MSEYLTNGAALTHTADRIRAKTGSAAKLTWDDAKGFGDAVDAIQAGGSTTPPAIAIAQFPVAASIDGELGSLTIDFAGLQQYMSATKTYAWQLAMWRATWAETSANYVVNSFVVNGRVSKGSNIDANDCRVTRTPPTALTMPYQLNVADFKKSRTVAGTAVTIVSNTTGTTWAGEYIGLFTLLPPYTDTYTGDKLTECPDGFLTVAATTESIQSDDIPAEDALSITGGVT